MRTNPPTVSYNKMTPAQKSAHTRAVRAAAKTNNPIGYQVAQLYVSKGWSAAEIATHLGITNYQARGHMTRVSRGDFDSCRF